VAEGGVLELLVENAWVVETLKALGSGHMLHLSFSYDQVEPDTLVGLKTGALCPGVLGEILMLGPMWRRVATFELQKINDLKGFVRLDFRLLSVTPYVRDGQRADGDLYRCRYRRSAQENT